MANMRSRKKGGTFISLFLSLIIASSSFSFSFALDGENGSAHAIGDSASDSKAVTTQDESRSEATGGAADFSESTADDEATISEDMDNPASNDSNTVSEGEPDPGTDEGSVSVQNDEASDADEDTNETPSAILPKKSSLNAPLKAPVVNGDLTEVYDWDDLREAVAAGKNEIKLMNDMVATGAAVEITYDVTIISESATVYRDATATTYDSVFKVSGGTLTLGEGVTFSGYVADPADPTTAKIRNWTDLGGYPRNEGYNKRALKDGLRGFFVEVGASGTLVIDGATIKQYTTEALWNQKDIIKDVKPDTPIGVSPIYVAGNFEMTSGTIEGNFASAIGKSNLVYQAKISGYGADQYVNDTVGLLPLAKGLSGASRMNNLGANIGKFSAGAVFLDGANANYKITGGEIKNNGGNTGAIIVNKGQLTIGGNAAISDNYADYTAAIFISSDAGDVRMCSGNINNNFGGTGGGVLAANNGSFFLMGGTIDGNYSINNGGGILIYSNNVHLIKGNIINNASGTMGGGIYVYGNDNKSANQSYTTVITNAEITDNTAVYTPGRAATSESEALGVYTADWKADNEISDTIYPRGAGGGVWLCPAGITSFDVSAADLYGNTAQYQGDDFLKDAGFDGGLLVDFGPHDQLKQWIHDEKTARDDASQAKSFTVAEATSGTLEMFGLKNTGGATNNNTGGVVITGNASRRGGGIGSDGSVFLINGNEVDIDNGSLTYKKTFDDAIPEEPMEFEMVLTDADGKPMLDDNDEEIVVATFHLYDKDYATNYEKQRTTVGSPVYGQGKATWSKADGVISTTEAANYSQIKIEFSKGNEQANFFTETDNGEKAEFHIQMREYHLNDDGTRGAKVSERIFSSTDPEFVDKTQEHLQTYTYYEGPASCTDQTCDDCSPGEPKEFTVYNRTYNFKAAGENKPDTPEIEKYVDEAVHKNIALKDVFTYNILAYVTADADEMVVTDKLNDQLQFVSAASEVKVYDLGLDTDDVTPLDSNHLPVYDVSGNAINNGKVKPSVQEGTAIDIKNNDYSKVTISDDTLTVKIANELVDDGNGGKTNAANNQELTDLRGHYIRIEFKAKIKNEIIKAIDVDKTMSYSNLDMTKIEASEEYKDGVNGNDERGEPYKGNDPVKSSQDHVGIPNTAYYTIDVKNGAKYQDSSNTVTVNPAGEIEKYINKDVDAHLVEFDKAFTYDILAHVPVDADKVVITDTLVKSLEFSSTGDSKGVASTNPSEVIARVAVKDENNHFAASKAGDGETPTVSDADALANPATTLTADTDYKATISGKKLTVTVDDAADYRGKWIQVTFYAKYTDAAIQAASTNPPADNATITSNGAVISKIEGHDGTRNSASYTVTVDNKVKYSGSSNTVTHDAETTKLAVKKTWTEGEWPDGVNNVTFGLYSKKGTTETALQGTVASDGKYTYRAGGNATVVLNKDKQDLTVTNLPKLIDTEYVAKELKVNNTPVKNAIAKISDIISYIVSLVSQSGSNNEGYATTINNEKVETEKYVNNDVHAELVQFDKVFKYDIITYVSKDATELTITDPLPAAIEFAKKTNGDLTVKADKAESADETIEKIVAKASNNHTGSSAAGDDGSTVKGTDTGNTGTTLTPDTKSIDNNTLTIKFGDGTSLLPDTIRGKYIQVTFYAKYTQDVINGADAGDFTRVTDDGAVITTLPAHEGTANQAQVSMKVKNGATANLKTNIVTVPAQTTNVWVQKKWQDAEGHAIEWPKDDSGQPIKVHVNVYKNETGKAPVVVDTIELTSAGAVKSKDYPKLVDVTYSADEAEIPEGYLKAGAVSGKGTEEKPFVITNKAIGGPEIEKYVNQAVHKDIDLDEEFPYDIIAFVTNDAETVTITDTLNDDLQFVSDEADVEVTSLDSDNHKVTNDVKAVQVNSDATVAKDGTAVDNADVSIIDKTLTVKIADATNLRGKWVRVHFVARIADGKTAADLSYTPISAKAEEDRDEPNIGNAPVASDEDHTGVPNTASYVIGVINEADRLEDKYSDTSNTVTVKPKEHDIKISKNELGGSEIEGAKIEVKDKNGNVVDSWTSGTKPHELKLAEGEYELKEVVAPEGYNRVTTTIKFKVDSEGKVTLLTTEVDGGGKVSVNGTDHIILEDAPELFDVKISKNELGGSEIEGAKIEVRDKDGNVIDSWTSGTKPHELKLTEGEYELKEVVAPEGYKRVTTTIKFKVDSDGKVTLLTADVDNGGKISVLDTDHIVLEDAPEKVEEKEFDVKISKNSLGGKEIEGAKIEVRDKDGNVIDSWTSGTKPHELKLKEGEYELKEVVAPKGFNRVTTTIKFKVDSEGKVTLLTADVDNGGRISVLDTDHIILEDAPSPTVTKKVNNEDKYVTSDPDEVFTYVITSTLAYKPKKYYAVVDDIPGVLELVDTDNITITVNGDLLSDEDRDEILIIEDNKLTVAPTLEMIEEWAPFEMKIEFRCIFREDADLSAYTDGVKNIAFLNVDGEEFFPYDGDNEATVKGVYEEEEPEAEVKAGKKGVDTGDSNTIVFWSILMMISLCSAAFVITVRRRNN